MSRTITVVLEVKDQSAAKEFWDAHIGRREIHGCRVVALAEGDKVAEAAESFVDDDGDDLEII